MCQTMSVKTAIVIAIISANCCEDYRDSALVIAIYLHTAFDHPANDVHRRCRGVISFTHIRLQCAHRTHW